MDYRTVNKIMHSLQGAYTSQGSDKEAFQNVLTEMHGNNGQDLLKEKIKLSLEKL